MEKDEVRAVIKYFCKKGMSPTEIHDYFIKTLGDEYSSYSTVKNGLLNLGEGGRTWRVMNGLGAQEATAPDKRFPHIFLISS